MNKNWILVILFLLTSLSSYSAQTLKQKEYFAYPIQHRFGFYVDGGYDKMVPINFEKLEVTKGGPIGNIGFIYEYMNRHFVLNTGVSFGFLVGKYHLVDTLFDHKRIEDTEGFPFDLYVEQTKHDVLKFGMLDFPIMAGVNYKKFFVMAGVRFGVKVIDGTKVNGSIKFSGKYDAYVSKFEWMPNHGLRSGRYEVANESYLKFNMRFALEGGYNFRTIIRENFNFTPRVSLFASAGPFLPKMDISEQQISFSESIMEITSYNQKPLLAKGNHMLLDIQAGVKLSFLFLDKRLNKAVCKTCKQYQAMKQPYCPMCDKQRQRDKRVNRKKETYNHSWSE